MSSTPDGLLLVLYLLMAFYVAAASTPGSFNGKDSGEDIPKPVCAIVIVLLAAFWPLSCVAWWAMSDWEE